MAKQITTTIDTRVLDGILKHLDPNVENAVAKMAFVVEGHAKVNIQQMDAIDTGALLNSVGTSLKGGGTMQEAMANARARNPDAVVTPLPTPAQKHTAHVGPTVEYAADVHFGTGTMAGRPFLQKAVRDAEAAFKPLLKKAVTNGA